MSTVLIVGSGGHAKVVIELFRSVGVTDVGLIVRDHSSRPILGAPIVGLDCDLARLVAYSRRAFVAIGDNERRLQLGHDLARLGFEIVNAISPAANLSPTARLGRGIAIMAGATVNAEARIDDFAVINTGASVDHDCHVGEGAHVAPGSALAGNVIVGRLALMGIGSCAIPGVQIGERAMIGAGACVIRNIPCRAVALGVPARVVRIDT